MVVRVLVHDGRDQKCPEEFTGYVLCVADADVASEPAQSRAVSGMRVRSDGDGRGAENGEGIEGVKDVSESQACFFSFPLP